MTVHAHTGIARAEALASELRAAGRGAATACFDLTDAAATAVALDRLLADGPFQVLVHNAGVHHDVPLAGMAEPDWRAPIDVSLHGFYAVARPLLLPMIGTRWGRIVAISSLAAAAGNRGQANYAAAKAGLVGACRALALEVASRGITVNAVAPGYIASPAVAAVIDAKGLAATVPMKRAGQPQEVADLVAFLVSEQAAYITGETITIAGGLRLKPAVRTRPGQQNGHISAARRTASTSARRGSAPTVITAKHEEEGPPDEDPSARRRRCSRLSLVARDCRSPTRRSSSRPRPAPASVPVRPARHPATTAITGATSAKSEWRTPRRISAKRNIAARNGCRAHCVRDWRGEEFCRR